MNFYRKISLFLTILILVPSIASANDQLQQNTHTSKAVLVAKLIGYAGATVLAGAGTAALATLAIDLSKEKHPVAIFFTAPVIGISGLTMIPTAYMTCKMAQNTINAYHELKNS